VTVTVNPQSVNPVALNDAYSEPYDTTVTVAAPGVLGNDSDPQSDPLTAELVSDVSYGDLTFNSDGSFVYVPNMGFAGTDTFTYRAFDGLHYSNTATVYVTLRPPHTPTPVSPENGVAITDSSVTFVWEALPGAVNYRLVVSTSSNIWNSSAWKFNQVVGDVTTYIDTGYPRNGTKYYWWIIAYAADGSYSPIEEVQANVRWFTSEPSIGAPTLISPIGGAQVLGTSTTFQWTALAGAVDYRLVVSTSIDIMKSPYKFNAQVGNVTTYTDTGYAADGRSYFWWVFAYATDGSYSLLSAVKVNGQYFKSMPVITAPTLVSPINGAPVIGTSVTFQWNAVAGAVDYRLTVSTSYDIMKSDKYKFNQQVGNVTTYTDTGYAADGRSYFWWVFAYASDGTYSLFSQVIANGQWFKSYPSIGTPTLISPIGGVSVSGSSVNFQWSAVPDAVNYKLIVSTNYDIWKVDKYVFNQQVGNVTTYNVNLATGKTYFWWVFAYAADGSFSVVSQVIANGQWFKTVV
jgi:hypothetical protein